MKQHNRYQSYLSGPQTLTIPTRFAGLSLSNSYRGCSTSVITCKSRWHCHSIAKMLKMLKIVLLIVLLFICAGVKLQLALANGPTAIMSQSHRKGPHSTVPRV